MDDSFFGPENVLPLDIADSNMRLRIEQDRYESTAVDDYEQGIQFQYRKNIVRTYYFYEDDEGNWGTVGDHYVSTDDIRQISMLFQKMLTNQLDQFEYQTIPEDEGNPFMRLSCACNGNEYSFKIWISEGLFQEWLIVDLPHLTFEQFNEYAQVFLRWAKDFPVLTAEELATAYEVAF